MSDFKIIDLEKHWNTKYQTTEEHKLGWFETDLSPMLKLIDSAGLGKDKRVLLVGAGNTRLLDKLLSEGYFNIIASDLSKNALAELESRVTNTDKVEYIVDDLTAAKELNKIETVDLWIDRAVLHFFHKEEEINNYLELLNSKLNIGGYAIFAEFNTEGAMMCSGLPVKRYNIEMFNERLGEKYKLIDHFNYTYIMPSNAERPYIYSLYKRTS